MYVETELKKTKLCLKGAQENCKLSWMTLCTNLCDFWVMLAEYIDTDHCIIKYKKMHIKFICLEQAVCFQCLGLRYLWQNILFP